MTNEYNPSVTFEELLAEEQENEFSGAPTSISTGVTGNIKPEPKKSPGFNPHLTRWIFNPFEIIDLRNDGASSGMDFIANVRFNRVKSIPTHVAVASPYDIAASPVIGQSPVDGGPIGTEHSESNYNRFTRSAWMIAIEMVNKYGEKGVVDIEELAGASDETAALVNQALFGAEVKCVTDVNNPEMPVPVLPLLLEMLEHNARHVEIAHPETREVALKVARRVREAIRRAINNARIRTNEARKRMLDEKNPNRAFTIAEERCFLALGEEVPNQIPFVTRTAAQAVGAGGIDPSALAQAVVAGVRAAQVRPVTPGASIPTGLGGSTAPDMTEAELDATEFESLIDEPSVAAATEPIDFTVSEGDVEEAEEAEADNKNKKGKK